MNTSEKIASVVAQFIAADREEDRKRIAELERDLNAVVQCCGELRQSIDVYLAEIQRLTEKCAALVVENKRLAEYASSNWGVVETPAVKEEEDAWVVYDSEEQNRSQRIAGMRVAVEEDDWDWSSIDDARGFKTEAGAHACLRDMGKHWPNRRVITLAEARAIEAKR